MLSHILKKEKRERGRWTTIQWSEFVLLSLSDDSYLLVVILPFLFITYILRVTGNLAIITLTLVDFHLQTPPQVFLSLNFSILEISFTTECIGRFWGIIITKDKILSHNNCIVQQFFHTFMEFNEFPILIAMSLDHYVAICKPLHYTTIINRNLCILFVLYAWLGRFLTFSPHLMLLLQPDKCASNVMDNFACACLLLVQLSSQIQGS